MLNFSRVCHQKKLSTALTHDRSHIRASVQPPASLLPRRELLSRLLLHVHHLSGLRSTRVTPLPSNPVHHPPAAHSRGDASSSHHLTPPPPQPHL
jgi:hypothetical protein